MSRRTVAALAAVLFAVLGGFLLLSYVSGADTRARDGEDLADVLVVTADIQPGTDAAALTGSVTLEQVPTRLKAPGAVADLTELSGQVVTSSLLAGDQVVIGRFADPTTLTPAGTVAKPAADMVEVSLSLDSPRAVGGVLSAGDTVSVQLVSQTGTGTGIDDYSVSRVLTGVTVTRVNAPDDTTDPAATFTVTLALTAADAQDVIRGGSSGSVWLSLEQAGLTGGTTFTTTQTASLGADS